MKGNGGKPLEHAPNWSSFAFGFVEDKQWIAVNRFPTSVRGSRLLGLVDLQRVLDEDQAGRLA